MHGKLNSAAGAGSLGDPFQIVFNSPLAEVHRCGDLFVAQTTQDQLDNVGVLFGKPNGGDYRLPMLVWQRQRRS